MIRLNQETVQAFDRRMARHQIPLSDQPAYRKWIQLYLDFCEPEQAGIATRVSPHTFRHTFASHLSMAGYDLQTIQRLLGHGDMKTTMIYLQTVPGTTLKEAKSPLDL